MERIYIKNFKQLKEIDIPLKNLNVIIGDNASGKTTLMKVVYFMMEVRGEVQNHLLFAENTIPSSELKNDLTKMIKRLFFTFFAHDEYNPNTELTLLLKDKYYIKIKSTKKEIVKILFGNRFSKIFKEGEEVKKITKLVEILTNENEKKSIIDIYKETQKVPTIEKVMTTSSSYMPASRNTLLTLEHHLNEIYSKMERDLLQDEFPHYASSYEPIILRYIQHFKKVLIPFKKAGSFKKVLKNETVYRSLEKEFTQKFDIAYEKIRFLLKGDYQFSGRGEQLEYENGQQVNLNNASSGQQETIRILQDLFWSCITQKPSFRAIDEPEAHLYPTSQRYLVEYFSWFVNMNADNVMMLATHSPYILTSLNNCLYAGKLAQNADEETKNKISKTLHHQLWLSPNQVGVYKLKDGYLENIVDEESGLIDASKIDEVSEELNIDFDTLLDIELDLEKR